MIGQEICYAQSVPITNRSYLYEPLHDGDGADDDECRDHRENRDRHRPQRRWSGVCGAFAALPLGQRREVVEALPGVRRGGQPVVLRPTQRGQPAGGRRVRPLERTGLLLVGVGLQVAPPAGLHPVADEAMDGGEPAPQVQVGGVGGDFMKYDDADSSGPPMPRSRAIFAARIASMMMPAEFGESHTSSLSSALSGTSPNALPSSRMYAHLRSSSHGT